MSRPWILDADGVFLDERPYWEIALDVALSVHGLKQPNEPRWKEWVDVAFGNVRLQQVAKAAGYNSNWDLAAALTMAISDGTNRSRLRLRLQEEERPRQAWIELSSMAARTLRQQPLDPRARFYRELVEQFQRRIANGISWRLVGDATSTIDALKALAADAPLRVCTGRPRAELLGPLKQFDLVSLFDIDRSATAETVDEEGRGKPSPYPLQFAAGDDAEVTFVGDSWADYRCAAAARDGGLKVDYIHVLSQAATAEQIATIQADTTTSKLVTSISELTNDSMECAS